MPPGDRSLRAVRGATAATVTSAVALSGHLLGGGTMPSWLGLALPWWLSVAVCTVLAGARFSRPRMIAAVLTGQVLFHSLFSLGVASASPIAMTDPPGGHLGHGTHHAVAVAASAPSGLPAAAMTDHAGHGGAAMLLGHVLAALITALLLHHGEAVLFRCFGIVLRAARRLRRRAAGPGPVVLPRTARCAPPPRPTDLRRAQRAVLDPQPHRGPPSLRLA
ncbi:hypothetical protein ACT3TZ_06780 [Brachybacterium sp. AOP25-B2-12]|uniref:hypothetical protein n=1 Tax=Brachybacterium sp. AOP25-B2-12 TaxID=3457710 RepID=UPI004033B99F